MRDYDEDSFREKLLEDISSASVAWEYVEKKAKYLEDIEAKISAEKFKKKQRVEKFKGLTLGLYFAGLTTAGFLVSLVLYAMFITPLVFAFGPVAATIVLYVLSSKYKKTQVPIFEKSSNEIIANLEKEKKGIVDEIDSVLLQITGIFIADMTDYGKEKCADKYKELTDKSVIHDLLKNPAALNYIYELIKRDKASSLPSAISHAETVMAKIKEGEDNKELKDEWEDAEIIALKRNGIMLHCKMQNS